MIPSTEPRSRIVFADTADSEVQISKSLNHWLDEAQQWLIEHQLLSKEDLNRILKPSYDHLTPTMREKIVNWLQPQEIWRDEKLPGDGTATNGQVLRYLCRVVYEEMYQCRPPDADGSLGIQSAGGVLTHVEKGAKVAGRSYEAVLSRQAEILRNGFNELLSAEVHQDSITKLRTIAITDALAAEIDSCTVETAFIWAWKQIQSEVSRLLGTVSGIQANEQELQSFLEKVLLIRRIPDFQFIFSGYTFFDTVKVVQTQLNQAANDTISGTKNQG